MPNSLPASDQKDAPSTRQQPPATAPVQTDWTAVVGRHSMMMALEPRFMFDAAVAATADMVADQADAHAADVAQAAETADADGPDAPDAIDAHDAADLTPVAGETPGETLLRTFGDESDGQDPYTGSDDDDDDMDKLPVFAPFGGTLSGGSLVIDENSGFKDLPSLATILDQISLTEDIDGKCTVTISVGQGMVRINYDVTQHFGPEAVEITGNYENGESTLTIYAEKDDILFLLDKLQYKVKQDYFGADTFKIHEGDKAVGNPLNDCTVDITINHVNNPPKFNKEMGSGDLVMGYEDTPTEIKVVRPDGESYFFQISDVDVNNGLTGNDNLFTVKLSLGPNGGSLAYTGLTDNNDGTYSYTGTLEDVNTMFKGLKYQGAQDWYGDDLLTVQVWDHADKDPTQDPASLTTTVKIDITSVNDDPVVTTGDPFLKAEATEEDRNGVIIDQSMLKASDVDNLDSQLAVVVYVGSDYGDPLQYGWLERKVGDNWVKIQVSDAVWETDANGNRTLKSGKLIFAYSDLNASNGNKSIIRYVMNPDVEVRNDGTPGFPDADKFIFRVTDNVGGWTGENTFTINLKAKNDAPEIELTETPGTTRRDPDTGEVLLDIYEGQDQVVIRFDATDPDQPTPDKGLIFQITELPNAGTADSWDDGWLCWYDENSGQHLKIVDKATADPGEITLSDFNAMFQNGTATLDRHINELGYLTFMHSGKDGPEVGHPQYSGATRNLSFKVSVTDDGGGVTGGTPATTEFQVDVNVKPNNDHPEFVIVDGNGDPIAGDNNGMAQVPDPNGGNKDILVDWDKNDWDANPNPVIGEKDVTSWGMVQMGPDYFNGGLNVVDPDSAPANIIYTVKGGLTAADGTEQAIMYIRDSNGGYRTLREGDTFTQADVNAGNVYVRYLSGFRVEDGSTPPNHKGTLHISFAVSDGSQTAWMRDPGGKEHTNVRGGAGRWVVTGNDPQGNPIYAWRSITVTTIVNVDVVEGTDPSYYPQSTQIVGCDYKDEMYVAEGGKTIISDEMIDITLSVKKQAVDEHGQPKFTINNEGKKVPVWESSSTPKDPDSLRVVLQEEPKYGTLWWVERDSNGNIVAEKQLLIFDSFTVRDMKDGKVEYRHNGGEYFDESFSLSINEGGRTFSFKDPHDPSQTTDRIRVNIRVNAANDRPQVGNGSDLTAQEGQEGWNKPGNGRDDNLDYGTGAILTEEHLNIRDSDRTTGVGTPVGSSGDYANQANDPYSFVIVGKPSYGDIQVFENGAWRTLTDAEYARGNADFHSTATWDDAWRQGNANGVGKVYVFTRDQLTSGHIRYVHNGEDTGTDNHGNALNGGFRDSINFVVNDGKGFDPNGAGAFVYNPDGTVTSADGKDRYTMTSGGIWESDSGYRFKVDTYGNAFDITYGGQKVDGFVFNPRVTAGGEHFFVLDKNDNYVAWDGNSCTDLGGGAWEYVKDTDVYTFTVVNGAVTAAYKNGVAMEPKELLLTGTHQSSISNVGEIRVVIDPVNDAPQRTQDTIVETWEGGKRDPHSAPNLNTDGTVITQAHVDWMDTDNSNDQLQYTITENVKYGVLYLNVNGKWVAMGKGSVFTHQDILDGKVKYVHDGREAHLNDSVKFDLTDSAGTVNKDGLNKDHVIIFKIQRSNDNFELEVNANRQNGAAPDGKYYLVSDEGKPLGSTNGSFNGVFNISDYDVDQNRIPATDPGYDQTIGNPMKVTLTSVIDGTTAPWGRFYLGAETITLNGTTILSLTIDGKTYSLTVTESHGQLVMEGTQAALNHALKNLIGIKPSKEAGQMDTIDLNGYIKVNCHVDDLANGDEDGAAGPNASQPGGSEKQYGFAQEKSIRMYVNTTNQIPVITVDPGNTFVMNEDGVVFQGGQEADKPEYLKLVNGSNQPIFVISDVDASEYNGCEAKIWAENGVLSLGQKITGVTAKWDAATKTLTLTGSQDAINKALEVLRYMPDKDWNGTDHISMSYDDKYTDLNQSPSAKPGFVKVDNAVSIEVRPVNDAPTLEVPKGDMAVGETGWNHIGNVTVDDPADFGKGGHTGTAQGQDMEVTISSHERDPNNPTQFPNAKGQLAIVPDFDALTELQRSPNWTYVTVGTVTTITVKDDGGNVIAAYSRDSSAPSVITMVKDGVTYTVTDTGGGGYTVTDSTNTTVLTIVNSGTSVMKLIGSKDAINTFLSTLNYQYAPSKGSADPNSEVKITVTVNDKGNGSAIAGDNEKSTTKDFHVMVSNENDKPELTPSIAPENGDYKITVNEDREYKFSKDGNCKITISDPDMRPGDKMQMTIRLDGDGELKLPAGCDKYRIGTEPDGSIIFKASISQLQYILDNMIYKPPANYNDTGGNVAINIEVNDLGYYCHGKPNGSPADGLKAELQIDITVAPVNDAPSVNSGKGSYTMPPLVEDGPDSANPGKTVAEMFNPAFNDSRDNAPGGHGTSADDMLGIAIISNGANGTTQGSWQWYDSNAGQWKNIPNGLSKTNAFFVKSDTLIRFQPVANYHGTPPALTAHLVDDSDYDSSTNIGKVSLPKPTHGQAGHNLTKVGGETRYSSGTVKVSVTVTPVNDAPVVKPGGNVVKDGPDFVVNLQVNEDSTPSIGYNIDTYFGGAFDDSKDDVAGNPNGNANQFSGILITKVPDTTGKGTWQYKTSTGEWRDITLEDGKALYLDKNTNLRFRTATDYNGPASGLDSVGSLTVRLVENSQSFGASGTKIAMPTATGGSTAISADEITVRMVVKPVNDAPVVKDPNTGNSSSTVVVDLADQPEHVIGGTPAAVPEYSIKDMFTTGIHPIYDDSKDNSDASTANPFHGIVVVGSGETANKGTWQYMEDGDTTWKTLPSDMSEAQGFYLSPNAKIRFIPVDGYHGEAPELTVHLVDGSRPAGQAGFDATDKTTWLDLSGTNRGNKTSYSVDSVAITLTITPINDAPVVKPGGSVVKEGPNFVANLEMNEDAVPPNGHKVSDLFGAAFDDSKDAPAGNPSAHANTFSGIIITDVPDTAGKGVWEYKTKDGQWTTMTLENGKSLYLDKDSAIRFKANPDYNGPGTGQNSIGSLTVRLVENSQSFGPSGGTIATPTATGGSTAISADEITVRMVVKPINDAPVVKDPNTGASSSTVVVDLTDQPEHVIGGTPSPVPEYSINQMFNTGTNPIFNDSKDDSDATSANPFHGVVIVGSGATTNKGAWEYSEDGGTTWTTLPSDMSETQGFYLSPGAKIRFTPVDGYHGEAPALTVHLVDGSNTAAQTAFDPADKSTWLDLTGTKRGGTTCYSQDSVAITLTITPINDAPVVKPGGSVEKDSNNDFVVNLEMTEDKIHESEHTVQDLFGGAFDDSKDNPAGNPSVEADEFSGIIVTSIPNTAGKGVWQYKTSGGEWKAITVEPGKALFLDKDTAIRFKANPDYNGPTSGVSVGTGLFTVHLVEDSQTFTSGSQIVAATKGGSTPFSADGITVNLKVRAVNDAPVVKDPNTGSSSSTVVIDLTDQPEHVIGGTPSPVPEYSINQMFNTGTNPIFNDSKDDSDASTANPFYGVVIVGSGATTNIGAWQYSEDGGTTWKTLPSDMSETQGFYLGPNAKIRFTPVDGYHGEAPALTVHLVDGSDTAAQTAFDPADKTTWLDLTGAKRGGETCYSQDSVAITLTITPINDAPVVKPGGSVEKDSNNDFVVNLEMLEDETPENGYSLQGLFGGAFDDSKDNPAGNPDAHANNFAGIIITEIPDTAGKGVWQYRTSDGQWKAITLEPGKALYLDQDSAIRFKANDNYNGPTTGNSVGTGSFTVRLVEDSQTFGPSGGLMAIPAQTGGSTAYSADEITINMIVKPVNDAPIVFDPKTVNPSANVVIELPEQQEDRTGDSITPPAPEYAITDLFNTTPPGGVGTIFDDRADNSDSSTANDFHGIVVVGCEETTGKGAWWYDDGNGWRELPSGMTRGNGFYLSPNAKIKFAPDEEYFGNAPQLTVHLVDKSNPTGQSGFDPDDQSTWLDLSGDNRGGATAYSEDSVGITVYIRTKNSRPTIKDVEDFQYDPATQTGGVDQKGDPVRLAPDGNLTDRELDMNENWNGAIVTINRIDDQNDPDPNPNDVFGSINGPLTAGGKVTVKDADGRNVVVGTVVRNSGGQLVVRFNNNATPDLVDEAFRTITYRNMGEHSETVTLSYTVDDNNQGSATSRGEQGYGVNLTHTVTQTIDIVATPVAEDDVNAIDMTAGENTATGKLMENDDHPDFSHPDPDVQDRVTLTLDGAGSGPLVYQGEYGTVTIREDGTYEYVLDPTKDIGTGKTVTDTFTYSITDHNGRSAEAQLVITIKTPEPPPVEPPKDLPHIPQQEVGKEIPGTPGEPAYVPEDKRGGHPPSGSSIVTTVEVSANTFHQQATTQQKRAGRELGLMPPTYDELMDVTEYSPWPDDVQLYGNTDEKLAQLNVKQDFPLPEDLFVHSRKGEKLEYTASLPDGSPLPDWMEFDPDDFAITATPPEDAEGSLTVLVRAQDTKGNQADATVVFKIGDESDTVAVEEDERLSPEEEELATEENPELPTAQDQDQTDPDLILTNDWLLREEQDRQEAESRADPDDDDVHPGLASQIARTGSSGILTRARELVETLFIM